MSQLVRGFTAVCCLLRLLRLSLSVLNQYVSEQLADAVWSSVKLSTAGG